MNIQIKYAEEEFDCDCCGWSTGFHYEVTIHDEPFMKGYGDTHLAGGVYNLEQLNIAILEKLGYTVDVDVSDLEYFQ